MKPHRILTSAVFKSEVIVCKISLQKISPVSLHLQNNSESIHVRTFRDFSTSKAPQVYRKWCFTWNWKETYHVVVVSYRWQGFFSFQQTQEWKIQKRWLRFQEMALLTTARKQCCFRKGYEPSYILAFIIHAFIYLFKPPGVLCELCDWHNHTIYTTTFSILLLEATGNRTFGKANPKVELFELLVNRKTEAMLQS